MLTLSTGVYKAYSLDSDQHAVSCLISPCGRFVFLKVDNPKQPSVILRIELSTDIRLDFHHSAELSEEIGDEVLSSPVAHEFEFDTDYGKDKAYGFYYAPKVCIYWNMKIFSWCLVYESFKDFTSFPTLNLDKIRAEMIDP